MPVLKLQNDDPNAELEFETRCALKEDPETRLARWLEWNIQMLIWAESQRKTLLHDEYENSPKVLKRK